VLEAAIQYRNYILPFIVQVITFILYKVFHCSNKLKDKAYAALRGDLLIVKLKNLIDRIV
jgi:hypothetical protein